MLRLEKNGGSYNVSVRLRQKEPSLNRAFLTALAFALSIHLLAFFLFHIKLFQISPSTIFPPVQLLMEQHTSTSAISTEEEALPSNIIAPPPSLIPTYPSLPFITSYEGWSTLTYPTAENSIEPLALYHEAIPFESTYYPLKMQISGDLSDMKLIDNDHPELLEPQIKREPLTATVIDYEVRLDAKTGRLFWYELKSAILNRKATELAEKVLLGLQFERDPQQLFLSGEIRFTLLVSDLTPSLPEAL